MKKKSSELRVTLSPQYYGNNAYFKPKTNVATEKQINCFDRLLAIAKENGLLNNEMEQGLKRQARTKRGFSSAIFTLFTILRKANIDSRTGERIPEDSPFYSKTYNLYEVDNHFAREEEER